MRPLIIVHGGAWNIPKIYHQKHLNGISEAIEAGKNTLKKTDDAVLTILDIIVSLENCPAFDAGTGSFLNNTGEVEMDAALMNGKDLSVGAVAGLMQIKNPILVAEKVRTNSQHCLLIGNGALEFAIENNFQTCTTEELLVGREKKLYIELKAKKKVRIKSFFEQKDKPSDTVGAVVIDSKGNITAATSTGGTPFKLKGRVGDSPLVGSGFYADNQLGGVSCTGWGEAIMRTGLASYAVSLLRGGLDATQTSIKSINFLKNKVDGEGGIILIDKNSNYAFHYNTPYMAVGGCDLDGMEWCSIDKKMA